VIYLRNSGQTATGQRNCPVNRTHHGTHAPARALRGLTSLHDVISTWSPPHTRTRIPLSVSTARPYQFVLSCACFARPPPHQIRHACPLRMCQMFAIACCYAPQRMPFFSPTGGNLICDFPRLHRLLSSVSQSYLVIRTRHSGHRRSPLTGTWKSCTCASLYRRSSAVASRSRCRCWLKHGPHMETWWHGSIASVAV
jgi:hypothetical protein